MTVLATSTGSPTDIAANGQGVYWASTWPGALYPYIWQVGLDGGGMGMLTGMQQGLGSLQSGPDDLYWTQNSVGTSFFVNYLPLDGGAQSVLATPTEQILPPLAQNSTTVFYVTGQGLGETIWSVPLDGSAAPTAIVTGQGFVSAVAADDVHLFWGAQPNGDGVLYQASTSGASPTLLTTTFTSTIESIAVDATTIYFANLYSAMGSAPDTGVPINGIFTIPIGGGSVTRIGEIGFPLVLDATWVYFGTAKAGVAKIPKAGGPPVTILDVKDIEPYAFALGPTSVYGLTSGATSGQIVSTPK